MDHAHTELMEVTLVAEFSPAELSVEQLRKLREVWLVAAQASDLNAAFGVLTEQTSAILGAPVVLFARGNGRWVIAAKGGTDREGAATPSPAELEKLTLDDRQDETRLLEFPEGGRWTAVPLRVEERRWLLLLPGDWTAWPSTEWVHRFGRDASLAFKITAVHQDRKRAEQLLLGTYAFTRKLAQTIGGRQLYQFIVDTIARSVNAQQAALAIYDDEEAALAIAATHGYPAVLVEHVRILPGAGVIGGVFASRRPLLVSDVGRVPGLHSQRPRYKTASFMTLPLLVSEGALGVLSLADRSDGKPFDRADLTAARAMGAPAALALARHRLEAQARVLAHAAAVDPLTGLFNRRHFHTRVEEEIERARRYSLDLALLLIDIDNFKPLNDSLGHLAGDSVLRGVADILRHSVRVFDVCTRYGGEEFAILMPGTSAGSATHSAERIRQRVEAFRPDAVQLPPDMRVTVSIGLTVLSAGASSQDLIARADRALYRAKADGKNCVRLAEE